jgi:pilus assembly protein Flp/PilA
MVETQDDLTPVKRSHEQWKQELTMSNIFCRFVKDESGATAIEYGLLAGLIAIALITALNNLGTDLKDLFGRVGTELDGAVKK